LCACACVCDIASGRNLLLDGNQISEIGAGVLPPSVTLNLGGNQISEIGAGVLPSGLW
jgi:Leucine-rich repeat (LRR) protein